MVGIGVVRIRVRVGVISHLIHPHAPLTHNPSSQPTGGSFRAPFKNFEQPPKLDDKRKMEKQMQKETKNQ